MASFLEQINNKETRPAPLVQEKQEDLPFDEKLPPLGEPAILALEEETGDAADAFFKRPKNMFEPEEDPAPAPGTAPTASENAAPPAGLPTETPAETPADAAPAAQPAASAEAADLNTQEEPK